MNVGRRVAFALSLLLLAVSAKAEIKRSCSREVVCVVVDERSDRAEFFIETKGDPEITVTIELILDNADSTAAIPYSQVFSGRRVARAFTIRRRHDSRAWSYRYTYVWAWGSNRARHDDKQVYSLPYLEGERRISQGYDGTFTHHGDSRYAIDFDMPEGTPVHACRGGVVVSVVSDNRAGGNDPSLRSKSNQLKIRHSDGTIGEYDHFRWRGVVVAPGQTVQTGQLLGHSGSTGYTRGPHLHFEVHRRIDAHRRMTLPVKFRTAQGSPIVLEQGRSYRPPGSR